MLKSRTLGVFIEVEHSNVLSKKIGIIGGGQLGKMMILEAKKMGLTTIILDPTENCPAHSIADQHIVADFHDTIALKKLASMTDVLTYEFEHISVSALMGIEEEGYTIYPSVKSLEVIQNKYTQKMCLEECGIPVPRFLFVSNEEEIQKASERFGYPLVLKACTGGYDGKGNAVIRGAEEIEAAYQSLGSGSLPLMVEEFIPFIKEISVLSCRGIDGQIAVYPVGENIHVDSILMETKVPAQISDTVAKKAMDTAYEVMKVFGGVGMFCVEMFVTETGEVLLNEVAPRPHNSGHYSIEGCVTSQFEQHIRAIVGMPLGETTLIRPTVMRNLLGEEGYQGKTFVAGLEEGLRIQGLKLHIYGKEMTSPKRKMGHFTVTAPTLNEALEKAEKAQNLIKIISL